MLSLILLVAACVCFVLATIGIPSPRANLTALGLALWTASLLTTR